MLKRRVGEMENCLRGKGSLIKTVSYLMQVSRLQSEPKASDGCCCSFFNLDDHFESGAFSKAKKQVMLSILVHHRSICQPEVPVTRRHSRGSTDRKGYYNTVGGLLYEKGLNWCPEALRRLFTRQKLCLFPVRMIV
jgi:hypothetical protein